MLLEDVLVILARTTLALFLSVILAVVVYFGALLPVVQLSDLESVNYRLLAALSIGAGAGIGGSVGWFRKGPPLRCQFAVVGAAVAVSVLGAWVGEQFEMTLWGAALAGNVLLVSLGVARVLRAR